MKHCLVIALILLGFYFSSCNSERNRFDIDTNDAKIQKREIKRYGKALFEIDRDSFQFELRKLQPDFQIFLGTPEEIENPVNMQRIEAFVSDTLLRHVFRDVMQTFPDLEALSEDLTHAFTCYHYYFPEKPIPEVYTYISGFDYEHKIQFYDNKLLIALDMYLGNNYPDYKQLGLPAYVIDKFAPQHIPSDCLYEIAKTFVDTRKTGNNLLDRMIFEGKMHWFVKAMIPDISEQVLFDYTADQLNWVRQNEGLVWSFILENEMLYNPDPLIRQKFLAANPFTSYFGQKSPPRLGIYIGYRMINKYMERSSVSIEELMQEYDAMKILKDSRYKPEL